MNQHQQVGPLSCHFRRSTIDVYLAEPYRKKRRWTLDEEMDVAEALDEIMGDHPTLKVCLRDWPKHALGHAFIAAKMAIYERIWLQDGWYPIGPELRASESSVTLPGARRPDRPHHQ